MNPLELEVRLLSSVRSPEDLRLCADVGITGESFTGEGHGDVWAYIEEHILRHGEGPTSDDLASLHGFDLGSPGDLESYVNEVRKDQVRREAQAILMEGVPELDGDPVETVRKMSGQLTDLGKHRRRHLMFADGQALERLEKFDEMTEIVKKGGIVGIPTGLSFFDDRHLGFRPGEFVVVMGRSGVGKSWLLMRLGVEAYKHGKKILMVSPELTADEQALRFDTMLAGARNFRGFTNMDLVMGTADRDRYKEWLGKLSDRSDFAIVDASEEARALSFDDISALVYEHRPDQILVDGLHLIKSSNTGGDKAGWEVIKEGCELLKAVAQETGTVVIGATQPDRAGSKKGKRGKPADLDQIGYGLSIAQTADRIISLAYSLDHPMRRMVAVPKLRTGKEMRRPMVLHWDVDNGVIKVVPGSRDNFEEDGHDEGPKL